MTGTALTGANATRVMSEASRAVTGYYTQAGVTINDQERQITAQEQRVLDLVNQERAKRGMGALKFNSALIDAAVGHNLVMESIGRGVVKGDKTSHTQLGDGTPGDRIRAAGYRGAWGENLAEGHQSAEDVVRGWMNSPTHRANILNANFTEMGLAHGVADKTGVNFWSQTFGSGSR